LAKQYPVQIKVANRITIPKTIFKDLKLHDGDYILINQLENGTIEIIPAKIIPR